MKPRPEAQQAAGLMMPLGNGADVWKVAKTLRCEDRFILMTGGATTETLREFIEETEVPCIEKPITLGDIEAAIDACLAVVEPPRSALARG